MILWFYEIWSKQSRSGITIPLYPKWAEDWYKGYVAVKRLKLEEMICGVFIDT